MSGLAGLIKYLRQEAAKNLRDRKAFDERYGKGTGGAHYVKRARKLSEAADILAGLAPRDLRQIQVARWCAAAFGKEHQASLLQRGLRHAEEAIEAAQAAGAPEAQVAALVPYIYARPPGALRQELGGSGLTLLALAAAAHESADQAEADELARVLSKPLSHFAARNQAKNDAGFDALAYPTGGVS